MEVLKIDKGEEKPVKVNAETHVLLLQSDGEFVNHCFLGKDYEG